MTDTETTQVVLSGSCPDEVCKSIIFFRQTDLFVFCHRCGQRFDKNRIEDASIIEDRIQGRMNVIRGILLSSNRTSMKDSHSVKVNGLSNYHCKLISPLFTEYGMDKSTLKAKPLSELTNKATFDCSLLSNRCFTICREHLNITGYGRDGSGSDEYLKETLNNIEAANGSKEVLVPIHADGDGHCLVHAISRALTGRSLFWHSLRTHLKSHLTEMRRVYETLLEDFINTSEWDEIISECDPTYEPDETKNEVLGLRNVHIFGLANVLKRPIILFDSMSGMRSSGDYSALFLPSMFEAKECKSKNGELNPPICIAWSNAGRGHFIPLVGLRNERAPEIPISMLPDVWAVPRTRMWEYMDFSPEGSVVITGKPLQDSYVQKLVKCMDDLFLQKNGVHPLLVCDKYEYSYARCDATTNVTPEAVINETRRAAQDHRLYRCTDCLTLMTSPVLQEWLRPGNNGIIYNQAVSQYGILTEGCKYLFDDYGLLCHYDSKKDVLILDNMASQKCMACLSTHVRTVQIDGTVDYENGDKTLQRCYSKYCNCGYKHIYGGKLYDNPAKVITIGITWSGQVVCEDVTWFQFESDNSLNSNVFQIANQIINKHFPGDFRTDTLSAQIVDQLLDASKNIDEKRKQSQSSPMKTDNIPPKVTEVKSVLQVTEESSEGDSSSVTAVIKLPQEEIVTSSLDYSDVSLRLKQLDNEKKYLFLEKKKKAVIVQSVKISTVSPTKSAPSSSSSSIEDDLKQARLKLEAQQNDYKMKKLNEYSAQKFLRMLESHDDDDDTDVGYATNGSECSWDCESGADDTILNRSLREDDADADAEDDDDDEPATTVRVGPGYSVLAPRGVPRYSRGSRSRGLTRSISTAQLEEKKERQARARSRGNTAQSLRALHRKTKRWDL